MKICTAAQMRSMDSDAIKKVGIPGIILMENAAIACTKIIERLSVKKIGIFCGNGNNGGDGFAIARHLMGKNYEVTIFLVCGEEFSKDAFVNYNILRKMGANIIKLTEDNFSEYDITSGDLIVDAIFGTGVHGEIMGLAADVIKRINNNAKKVLSVDIPSGVNSDTGEICSVAVKADITVTFAAYKCGMFLYPGADFCGKIYIDDICMPETVTEKSDIAAKTIDVEMVKKIIPKRHNNSHKGDYGKILIIGGSEGMTGAPTLSAAAAMRSGAGLVTIGVPKSLNLIMEEKLTEAMTLPLPETNGGISENSYEKIFEKMKISDVVLLGPGCGRSDECCSLILKILKNSEIPIIIDADGLFALIGNLEALKDCSCEVVLTPHEMEFARLIDCDLEKVKNNRMRLAKEFAKKYKVTLVLKGHYTIITLPDGTQYINTTGNAGMATGGSGDVLAGIIAALLPVCENKAEAVMAAVCLHGLAGDLAAEKYGEISLNAGDIVNALSSAFSKISTGKNEDFMIQ